MKEISSINGNKIVTLKSLEDKIAKIKKEYNVNSENILIDVDNIVFYKRDKYDIVRK